MRPELKIYEAFYNAKRSLYFSELKRTTKMSISSLQNVLKILISQNDIKKIKTVNNTFYKLSDKKKTAIVYSLFALERFNSLNVQVRMPLESLILKSPEVFSIILFGSASRKQEKPQSDIDLLIILHDFPEIISDYPKTIRKIFEKIQKEISSQSIYTLSMTFIKRQELESKDTLLNQAIMTGFPIKNQQAYYETDRILEEYGIIGFRDIIRER
jgi:predicted nucleotidyltransferase